TAKTVIGISFAQMVNNFFFSSLVDFSNEIIATFGFDGYYIDAFERAFNQFSSFTRSTQSNSQHRFHGAPINKVVREDVKERWPQVEDKSRLSPKGAQYSSLPTSAPALNWPLTYRQSGCFAKLRALYLSQYSLFPMRP